MLFIMPIEIAGKWKFENGKPVATCELTDEEQKIFDDFCKDLEKAEANRFKWDDD